MEMPHARNLLKNAARTHHPLHAVLGVFVLRKALCPTQDTTVNLTKFYTQLNLWQSPRSLAYQNANHQNLLKKEKIFLIMTV